MASPPYRQIRAEYDNDTITVYQAYSDEIAISALHHQRLDASPAFSKTRMTWIKPSWTWMLYRSGYSYKDARQTRILALKLRRDVFDDLLSGAVLSHGAGAGAKTGKREKTQCVRVQWDPERTVRLERCGWRSIQVGVPGGEVGRRFVEGIVGIEDVTGRAKEVKALLDGEVEGGVRVGMDELVRRGLVVEEREYEVSEEVRGVLGMDLDVNMGLRKEDGEVENKVERKVENEDEDEGKKV